MNSLMNLFSGGANSSSVLLQALGAAMRGESPQAFMKKLANTDPRLKKMNLDDLYGSAQKLAQEQGVNIDDVQRQIDSAFSSQLK